MARPEKGRIKDEILRQIAQRGAGKTICPSEVARAFSDDDASWRALMPTVREVAYGLADEGRLVITKKGAPVTTIEAVGPIRLGLPQD
jgi:hypothetical protein